MHVNADSLLIRAATTSTSGPFNDLRTDLIMANNNMMRFVSFLLLGLWCLQIDMVVAVTVMCELLFVLHVCMLRECAGDGNAGMGIKEVWLW